MVTQIDDSIRILLRSLTSKQSYSSQDLQVLLDGTLADVLHKVEAQAVTFYELDENNMIHFARIHYAGYLYENDKVKENIFNKKKEQLLQSPPIELGRGVVGKVTQTGNSSIIEDVRAEGDHYAQISADVNFPVKSMMTVALKANRTIGAIQVMNKHIGDQAGTFTLEDLKLLEEVADYSAKIIEMVEDGSQISANELAVYKARLSGFEYQDIEQLELDQALLERVGQNPMRRYKIVPLSLQGKSIVLAVIDPLDFETIENFELMTGFKVKKKVISSADSIKKAIDKYFPQETKADMTEALTQLQEQYKGDDGVSKIEVEEGLKEDSSPIVKLVTQVIETAYEKGASDIHIEPFESNVLVRFRVDGVLEKIFEIPKHAQNAFMSRLKIIANLNIAERRLPQDGRIAFAKVGGKYDVDLRVNIYPMIFGEKAVMRILDKTGSIVPLDKMGFSEHNLKTYRSAIKSPYGMILHVGPTGSGKTTTLYSALSEVNKPEINIQTVEDPVEYMLEGINQGQMNSKIGLTFASSLRAYLRQDPDVIMVGEIRDKETAEIAIEAALTGHLMFSTMHTNDAVGTVTRFTDMGVEPFLVSSSLLCVVAQRLLRKLCECKLPHEPNDEEKEIMGEDYTGQTIYRANPEGCSVCKSGGYKGRMGMHEVLTMNDELTALINSEAPTEKIREAAVKNGTIFLFQDGIRKVIAGQTSIEEIVRVSK